MTAFQILNPFSLAPNDCWNWTGYIRKNGYGQLRVRGDKLPWLAHRYVYSQLVGPLVEGHDLDHLCRNKACVNPKHLEQVTHRENCLRGDSFAAVQARKTHCMRGHEFTPENTWRQPSKQGKGRACKICQKEHNTLYTAIRRSRRQRYAAWKKRIAQ